MAEGIKITEMTNASDINDADVLPIVQEDLNKSATFQQVKSYIKNSGGHNSGFDADTLDGYHASAFATAAQGAKADLALPANSYTAQDALAKIKTVDGTGSGLDADLLDGKHASDFVIGNFVGAVLYFARPTAPAGWLVCDGREVSRTTFATLFAAIGTTHGAGDNFTTFRLPDLRGTFIRGIDAPGGTDDGGTVRSARGLDIDGTARTVGQTQTDAFKSHDHDLWVSERNSSSSGGTVGAAPQVGNGDVTTNPYGTDTTSIRPVGGTETRPVNMVLLPCIKY